MALNKDYTKHIGRIVTPSLGSDPELFIATTSGTVIGAEKVIPKGGLFGGSQGMAKPSIVLDGVQVELHPRPDHCRARIANDFKAIFTKLDQQLKEKGASASFNPVVTLSKDEMASLSKAAQQLGCAPSRNVYDPNATIKVPKGFRMRSAGGHIHVSAVTYNREGTRSECINSTPQKIERFVKICDLFLGIPGVLLDRDPQAAVRRKVYGRASEHRTPSYGIEYRVLSNYWLRSYQLMSFVYGMARQSCNVFAKGITYPAINNQWDGAEELFRRVDFEKVRKAINTNNVDMAWKQWDGIESFIEEFCVDGQSGLWSGESLPSFRFFAKKVQEKGLEYWFPEDPMTHWTNIPEGHTENDKGYAGWETYLIKAVQDKRVDVEVDDVIARLTAPIVINAPRPTRKRIPKVAPKPGISVAALATNLMSNLKGAAV